MQYVMLVRVDPELPVPERDADPSAWVDEGSRTGMRVEGGPIQGTPAAKVVRVRERETLVSGGALAESAEYIAGYDLLEADSLEQAADYASRPPVAKFGALEVREVWPDFVEDATDVPEPRTDGEDYLFLHVPDPELLKTATRETGDPTP